MSYELKRVKNREFEMRYIKFGTGEKTFVILPGLSVQSVIPAGAVIETQYELFKKDFTVYLFDRREKLPPVYSIYDMANDTAKAIKQLGLSDVYLFGASQGGMMAMTIAAVHPEMVARLVLGSTSCHITGNRGTVINEWLTLAKKGETEKLYLSFGEKVYTPGVFNANKQEFINLARTVTDTDLKRFIILAEGTKGFDFTDMLKEISCPVLAIGDTHDRVLGSVAVHEIAEQLRSNPVFEAYMYRGYGHAAYDTAPDYKQRLYDFFTKRVNN